MKKILNVIIVALFITTTTVMSQHKISGTIVDETGQPLPGASVHEKGTSNGVDSDFNGKFSINTKYKKGTLVFSFVSYASKSIYFTTGGDLGKIKLTPKGNVLKEVVIKGLIDVAKNRETPVAVSTIKASEIQEKLGSQEFPEILNYTPSVYATKSGGGFGDSRINIRGFNQENIAVLINGVPVNDMENNKVYWSNWAGLSDVTTAMQVQRGLGSSKLALSSVGGTINIITKTTDKAQGGSILGSYGNNNYLKTLATYSTGKNDNGFAASFLLSRTSGDGYVNGTKFEGYNYFIGLGWELNDNHDLQFMVTGAPQTHNQRTSSFYNMASLADYIKYGKKYNSNYGYLNGKEFNWRKNFYHKPVISANWNWNINDNSSLSTSAYLSFGRGGGTGEIGKLPGHKYVSNPMFRNKENGQVLWDKIVDYNKGKTVVFSDGNSYTRPKDGKINDDNENGLTRRASINSHNWAGILSNFNTKLSDKLTFDFGIDLRDYTGKHYRRVDNLLGAVAFKDTRDINNNPNNVTQINSSNINSLWNVFKNSDDEVKINYYNEGKVRWLGAFSQLEYKTDVISAFIQGAVSNQGFKRIDYFNYLKTDNDRESKWQNHLGGNIKSGINWNINDNHNIFANAGYYSKQPFFDAVFLNYKNNINKNARNEKVISYELGYGYKTYRFNLNANFYITQWKDRFYRIAFKDKLGNRGSADINGVAQIHSGIELETTYNVTDNVKLLGMISIGDWEYEKTVSGKAYDQNQKKLGDVTLYLDGVKVGDAAQTTGRLGIEAKLFKGFKIDYSQRFVDRLYASVNASDFSKKNHKGSLELPGYSLSDLGLSYNWMFNKNTNGLNFRLNINNLFDQEYISESKTNYFVGDKKNTKTYRGINTSNKVFFGFGTTWNFSIRYKF